MKVQQVVQRGAAVWLSVALGACGAGPGGGDAGVDGGGGGAEDAGVCAAAAYTENLAACSRPATDYQPASRDAGVTGWPACVSDDGVWHLMGASLPAASARVAAFEAMAPKLWANPSAPTPQDFLSARDDYSVPNGLASRVARRQDVSYPEVPGSDKFACQNGDGGIAAMYPDRCAGPAKLKPLIDDAFQKGSAGTTPRVQAARLEAALLWFLALSVTSEIWTCSFDDMADCDSAGAYYSGELQRATPAGLGRYVRSLGPGTHDRVFDALLGERCWRDVDRALPATNTALYDRALAQTSKSLTRGVALILRERVGRLRCTTGDAQEAAVEFVKVLGGFLAHPAASKNATVAASLKAFTDAPTADAARVTQAQADLDTLFVCP